MKYLWVISRVFVVLAAAYWLESSGGSAWAVAAYGGVRKCHLLAGNIQPYQIMHAHALANNYNKSQNINFPQRDRACARDLQRTRTARHCLKFTAVIFGSLSKSKMLCRCARDDIDGILVEAVGPGWFVMFERLPFSWYARHVFQYGGYYW